MKSELKSLNSYTYALDNKYTNKNAKKQNDIENKKSEVNNFHNTNFHKSYSQKKIEINYEPSDKIFEPLDTSNSINKKDLFIPINQNDNEKENDYNIIKNNFYHDNDNIENIYFQNDTKQLNKELQKLKKDNNSLIKKLQKAHNIIELSKTKLDEQQKEIINLKNNILNLKELLIKKDKSIKSLNENIVNLKNLNTENEKSIQQLNNKSLKFEKDSKVHNNVLDLLQIEKIKNENLNRKIDSISKFNDKKEKLLDILFNFFNNIKHLLCLISTEIPARKEYINDVLDFENLGDFDDRLKELVQKCAEIVAEAKLRIGKYFPCDITCCTTKNERMKFFKNNK